MLNPFTTLVTLVAFAQDRLKQEKGATAVEYGLMVGLIAVVIIARRHACSATSCATSSRPSPTSCGGAGGALAAAPLIPS